MANSLSTNASVNGNVNGMAIGINGSITTSPTGSTSVQESFLVNTGSYQLVLTGSTIQNVGTIIALNTSPTGSIQLQVSYSGISANLGTLPPSSTGNGTPSLLQWNAPITGLYAQAFTTQSYGVFALITQ